MILPAIPTPSLDRRACPITSLEANPEGALSIVIPLYQEASGVRALAAALAELEKNAAKIRRLELILVDDGSTDGTGALLRENFANCKAVILLHHDHNRGLCEALLTGSDAASSPYLAWLDSDLSYDPQICLQLAVELDRGADLAVASCYHPQGLVEGVPGWRLFLSALASRLYRRLCGRSLHTYTCMVRVFRRDLLLTCRPRRGGFIGVTEMLLRCLRQGARCVEIPATLRRRHLGQSKMRVLGVGFGHLGLMLAWLTRRL